LTSATAAAKPAALIDSNAVTKLAVSDEIGLNCVSSVPLDTAAPGLQKPSSLPEPEPHLSTFPATRRDVCLVLPKPSSRPLQHSESLDRPECDVSTLATTVPMEARTSPKATLLPLQPTHSAMGSSGNPIFAAASSSEPSSISKATLPQPSLTNVAA